MSDSEVSFTSRFSCECYKKLQSSGIPLRISDENEFLSEYQAIVLYENAFPLPGYMKINKDIKEYPVVEDNCLSYVFQEMARVIPSLSDFEQNVLSFYILDVIIEGLWTVQNEKMNFDHQKATLLWILYFFNYIQEHNPSREDLFDHLKIALFSNKKMEEFEEESGELIETIRSEDLKTENSNSIDVNQKIWPLPLPPDYASNLSTSEEDIVTSSDQDAETKTSSSSPSHLNDQIYQTDTNIEHIKIILEILYRIFAKFSVFLDIQTVVHSMPPVKQVDLPFTLNSPKPLLKIEPSFIKPDKNVKKQTTLEKPFETLEFLTQSKNDFILPLQMAEESKLYLKQLFGPQSSQRSTIGKNKEEKNKK